MLKFTERKENGVFGDVITLENGVELFPEDWNGEVYTIKENGRERTFKPVYEPISFDDDGEPEQWGLIGYDAI